MLLDTHDVIKNEELINVDMYKAFSKILFIWVSVFLPSCSCESKINNTIVGRNYHDIQVDSFIEPLNPIFPDSANQNGFNCGFVNDNNDTVIPIGKYSFCWSHTFDNFIIVSDEINTNGNTVGIDREENILFDAYLFDNGPDKISCGLFRVKRYNLIGYANRYGRIVIPCVYECAEVFLNGKAKVSLDCELISDGERTVMKSDNWFYLDTLGNKIESKSGE